ncbi:thioredoxin [Alistipes sp. ZOR0009]|uniref:thioredoxin n=1 Tax=Alistipes sp. ZOR0009 TaxID=1339253 RepID=UPI000648D5E9|nr:thioredoxin [Alistipes sp. ZOR0009]
MAKNITTQEFKDLVFNYDESKEWKFKGDKPAVIDFYADWCAPCKMVAPIIEELSSEFEGKIDFYKVNTEVEQELSGAFGIRSIPSILFIPVEGQPQMSAGALPKNTFKEAFKDIFNVQ